MNNPAATAVLIVIGNEILSGRTIDTNTQFIATELANLGINLREVRIIKDDKENIINTINHFRQIVDLIFTTGGIGTTHDDITSEAVAEAFGRKYIKNEQAAQLLVDYYRENINEVRMKMAYMPENVSLICDKVNQVPGTGFIIENVFVMAGSPKIMKGMFEGIKPLLPKGEAIVSKSEDIMIAESRIAQEIAKIQDMYPEVEVGSYPFELDGKHGTSVAARSANKAKLMECYQAIANLAYKYNNSAK